ncbi:MAG: bile acid:sodium symporter [Geminicoccaceae bacterium]|nr:bile acid:sodium symporter [Geminicoccaceae bacterium]
MSREALERRQVWLYLAAILAGLGVGGLVPRAGPHLEALLWPALGALLYATFTQIPLLRLLDAARDARFLAALLVGNFLLVPPIVGILLLLLPVEPAVRLGVLLVLLVPCTDWFVTFTHLAGGDTRRAVIATPLLLFVQIVLLPVYLWLFMGSSFAEILVAERIATVFALIVLAPLAAAWLTERRAERRGVRGRLVERLAWLPVPLLALVVFLIAASQVHAVVGAVAEMGRVAVLFLLYLVAAALAGIGLARLARLPAPAGRALVFSLGTRNSFVVLPLALALPAPWQAATVVIVLQSLVELFGMLAYLRFVPLLLPTTAPAAPRRRG